MNTNLHPVMQEALAPHLALLKGKLTPEQIKAEAEVLLAIAAQWNGYYASRDAALLAHQIKYQGRNAP
jgi:hypothetical protein